MCSPAGIKMKGGAGYRPTLPPPPFSSAAHAVDSHLVPFTLHTHIRAKGQGSRSNLPLAASVRVVCERRAESSALLNYCPSVYAS